MHVGLMLFVLVAGSVSGRRAVPSPPIDVDVPVRQLSAPPWVPIAVELARLIFSPSKPQTQQDIIVLDDDDLDTTRVASEVQQPPTTTPRPRRKVLLDVDDVQGATEPYESYDAWPPGLAWKRKNKY